MNPDSVSVVLQSCERYFSWSNSLISLSVAMAWATTVLIYFVVVFLIIFRYIKKGPLEIITKTKQCLLEFAVIPLKVQ